MPNYKTHSIHTELVMAELDKKSDINTEELKRFAFGPDALMTTDYKLFEYQHAHCTGHFFNTLIKYIKDEKLQDNGKVMAFLYGQLDHYILDTIMHPLIYYMTERLPVKYKINPHALIEMWIDDYVLLKYNKRNYNYDSTPSISVLDKDLANAINDTYYSIYKNLNTATKYDVGIFSLVQFDDIRKSKSKFLKRFCQRLKIGDFFYSKNISRISKYLNLEHKALTHPITGDKFMDSFDDLWRRSLILSEELISDVNNYLYSGKALNNYYIRNNISYNTGLPCCDKEEFKYVRRYK